MTNRNLAALTNDELLAESKRIRTANILNAFLIGFFAGIIAFSIFMNTWGLLTLIPLFFIYALVNKNKPDTKELNALLEERGLK